MKTLTKRGLIFSLTFIFVLLNLFFVSAEEGIKISKFSSYSYLQFIVLPIIFAIVAFFVGLIFLRGKLIDKPWLKGAIVGFIIGLVYSISRYKSSLLFSYIGWLPIFFITIAFILVFVTFASFKNSQIPFTKRGFWVGLTISFIILYSGSYYSFITSVSRPDYHDFYYTIFFVILAIITPSLIGFISQKIKEGNAWQNWSYTKKGFTLGAISSILILISWVAYLIFEGGVFTYGVGYIFKDSMVNLILSFSIVLPVLLFTIVGLIIQKIKSQ